MISTNKPVLALLLAASLFSNNPGYAAENVFGALSISPSKVPLSVDIRSLPRSEELQGFSIQATNQVSIDDIYVRVKTNDLSNLNVDSFYLQSERVRSGRTNLRNGEILKFSFSGNYGLRAGKTDQLYIFGRTLGRLPADLEFEIVDVKQSRPTEGLNKVLFITDNVNERSARPASVLDKSSVDFATMVKKEQARRLALKTTYEDRFRGSIFPSSLSKRKNKSTFGAKSRPTFRKPGLNSRSINTQITKVKNKQKFADSDSVQQFLTNQALQRELKVDIESKSNLVDLTLLVPGQQVEIGNYVLKNQTVASQNIRNFFFQSTGSVRFNEIFDEIWLINDRNGTVLSVETSVTDDGILLSLEDLYRLRSRAFENGFTLVGTVSGEASYPNETVEVKLVSVGNQVD